MHIIEATCDLIGNGRFSRACLPEKDEATLGSGMIHPVDNEVQEGCARSRKAALVGCESRACPVWYFSDFCIQLCDNAQIDDVQGICTAYRRPRLGQTSTSTG